MSYRPKTRLEKILNGQIMKARSGLEAAVQAALERTKPMEANCTISVDSQTGKQTITTDLTAAELFEAVNAGRLFRAIIGVSVDGQTISFPKIVLIDSQALGDDDETVYEFSFSTTSSSDGLIGFIAADLSAGDTVVFRQV